MEHTYYRIGEVSRVTGISKDTLHFYNKIGLLVPDHIDPDNQYRYYSLRNLWQLDIITTCRKLNIPLETVRQILSLRDNGEITRLLMEYRQEAIRLSRYYQQVAEDISWYGEEKERIERQKDRTEIQKKWLEEEVVIAGSFSKDARSYHASLQDGQGGTAARPIHQKKVRLYAGYGRVETGQGHQVQRISQAGASGVHPHFPGESVSDPGGNLPRIYLTDQE